MVFPLRGNSERRLAFWDIFRINSLDSQSVYELFVFTLSSLLDRNGLFWDYQLARHGRLVFYVLGVDFGALITVEPPYRYQCPLPRFGLQT